MDLYTWYQWLAFFYLYSFLGWIFESSYVSLLKRRFVNRGFLRIPLLPLYGSGALMMLAVSRPFQESLILTWFSGFVGATILEYIVGWAMEQLFKIRYWDYSSQKFNFQGYICLSSSIAWGFLTIFMTHVIHRPIARFVCSMPAFWELLFVSAATAVFLADAAVCTRKALDFGRSLEASKRLRQELESIRVQTALLRMDAGDRISEKRAELENWLEELRMRTGDRIEDFYGKSEQQLRELSREKEEMLSALRSRRKQFLQQALRSNPTIASHKYAEELKEMIQILDESKKKWNSDRKRR
ncbi:MAG: hypothetical protein KH353_02455 [Clostridium sp.]|nr:hypothetical protein [Clostridium sp.]